MSSRPFPPGFIEPCLPSSAPQPPSGHEWLHEIKHDGFRVIARKHGDRVKLYSRPGNDLTHRFPLIVGALAKLWVGSCIVDGEAVACGEDGIASFERIRYRRHDASVLLFENEDGPLVFAHACKLGLEGIVSKRRDSLYRSGRSPHWISWDSQRRSTNLADYGLRAVRPVSGSGH